MADIGGGAGIPRRFVGPMLCGASMGTAPAGVATAGTREGADAPPLSASRTKLRLFGNSSVSSRVLRSRMFTGFGQLVAAISTRNEFVPTVYSKALVSGPRIIRARSRPSNPRAVDAKTPRLPMIGSTRRNLCE